MSDLAVQLETVLFALILDGQPCDLLAQPCAVGETVQAMLAEYAAQEAPRED